MVISFCILSFKKNYLKQKKMAGILDLLNSDLGKQIISGVAGSRRNDTNKTGMY